MYYESIEISMDEALRKRLRTTGVLLLSIGGLGVLLPQIISITLSLLTASLLILAGLVVTYFTWHSYNRSALTLRLRAYMGSMHNRLRITSDLYRAINDKLNTAGIAIAFPQLDVHVGTATKLDIELGGTEKPRG